MAGFGVLEVFECGPYLLLLLKEFGEPDPQLRGLGFDLGEAQGELPLVGGCLGGAPLRAVALAHVLQAVGGALPDALSPGLELVAPDVVQPPTHPLIGEQLRDDLRRAALEVSAGHRRSSCFTRIVAPARGYAAVPSRVSIGYLAAWCTSLTTTRPPAPEPSIRER